MDLSGKTAIVTGVTSGMGVAIVESLAGAGMNLAIAARRVELLEKAAEVARAAGAEVLAEPLDVADRAATSAFARAALDLFGGVDVLVNNAGTNSDPRTVAEIDPQDWDRVVRVNLTGAFNLAHALIPSMRAAGGGLIINVASLAAFIPSGMAGSAYSASKAAMRALSININDEEWRNGIRATTIHPGETDTPILDLRPEPPSAAERARMVQVEDIAEAVLFVVQLPARTKIDELIITPTHRRRG
jgi:NAD(P)-dependent dehydrogenase (short-subunit alcohol dehydrogenase family)